jgi:hypothetical protein
MNKKWFFMLIGIFLSAMLVGCNVDPDPAPPEDNNGVDENGANNNDNNADDIIEGEENIPGVDEDDNMFKDDEEDADPDPEDLIEDPEDIQDKDNLDE